MAYSDPVFVCDGDATQGYASTMTAPTSCMRRPARRTDVTPRSSSGTGRISSFADHVDAVEVHGGCQSNVYTYAGMARLPARIFLR